MLYTVTPSRLDGRSPRFFLPHVVETLEEAIEVKAHIEQREDGQGTRVWAAYINEAEVVDGVLAIGRMIEEDRDATG